MATDRELDAWAEQLRKTHPDIAEYLRSCAVLPQTEKELRKELADMNATFDIMWSCDIRAMRMWQDATGKTHTHPDGAKLRVWLMNQLLETLEMKDAPSKTSREDHPVRSRNGRDEKSV